MRILGTEVTAEDMRSADLHSRQILGELSTCGDANDKYQRKSKTEYNRRWGNQYKRMWQGEKEDGWFSVK